MSSPLAPRRRGIRGGAAVVALIVGASAGLWAAPAGAAPAPTDSPATRAAAVIRPAVVYLESAIPGSATTRCSGFVVNPDGYIATAGHCVDPQHLTGDDTTAASSNQILDEIATTGLEVSVLLPDPTGDTVKPVAARVVDVRSLRQGDLALLKVARTNLPSSELSATRPEIAQPVQAIGYPVDTETDAQIDFATLEPTARSGAVSAIKTLGASSVIEVSAEMSPGMSGGPTIGEDGKVIGVNSFRKSDDAGAYYVTAAAELSEMMKNNGVTSALSAADEAYRTGLDEYYSGDFSAAIENFDKSTQLSPGYPNVAELKTDAVRRREAAGGGTGSTSDITSTLLIGGAVLVALALAGGIGFYLYTRRGNRAAGDVPGDVLPAGAYARPPAPGAGPAPTPGPAAAATTQPMGPPQTTGGIRCRNCGFEIPPGQAFCGRCGTRQD